ncbi:MAG: hypothetical protein WBC50_04240 [Dehalococcoidales bacterium]
MSALDEWKVATENARHFNDLLMRIRTLGLSMVITIIAAGAILLGTGLNFPITRLYIHIAGLLISLGLLIFYITSLLRKDWSNKNEFPAPLYLSERIMWGVIVLTVLGLFFGAFINDCFFAKCLNDGREYPVGVFVILAGLGLLTAIYAMDRFYYYKLLIGTIVRASELEELPTLSFRLTKKINDSIPQNKASRLITFFYAIPGICALIVALFLLLFVDITTV